MKYVLLAVGLLTADQWSKWMVMEKMSPGESIPVIDRLFYLTYVRNPGAAFGMLPNKTAFFIIITAGVILGILWFARRIEGERSLLKSGLALQAGGALGNLIDRLRFGHVVDFLDVRVWPVFNVADIGLVIGVGILFIEVLRWDNFPGKKEDPADQEE